MTQYSLGKELKKFKEKAAEAVVDKITQLHEKETFEPVNYEDISEEERDEALEALMFLKEKRDGRIKEQTCADGRKQRKRLNRNDVISPTVMIESVLITASIEAKEGREVATTDIHRLYLLAEMDELIHMKLEGRLAELLVRIAPQ
eukprot:1273410-Ditylum_brightwellii.AAC.1